MPNREASHVTEQTGRCAVALPDGVAASAAAGGEWVRLMPVGRIDAADGRKWVNDDPDAVVEASRPASVDMVVDFDHQSEYTKNGTPAPAAGWIRDLKHEAGFIWGLVEWTRAAMERLADRQYRYISPVFRAPGGAVKKILRAGLTNTPAIHELPAVASNQENNVSDFIEAVAAALGQEADSTATQVVDALKRRLAESERRLELLAAATEVLGLSGDTTVADIEKAAADLRRPDPARYVDRAAFDDVNGRLGALEKASTENKARAAVDKAMADRKVTPAMEPWALELATKNPEAFAEFCAKQPAVIAQAGAPAGQPPAAGGSLTAEDLAVCKAMGLDVETFKAARAAETGQEAA